MSYVNVIRFEAIRPAISVPVAAATRPRLIWAERNIFGFLGQSGLAAAAFGSLAWMFISC